MSRFDFEVFFALILISIVDVEHEHYADRQRQTDSVINTCMSCTFSDVSVFSRLISIVDVKVNT